MAKPAKRRRQPGQAPKQEKRKRDGRKSLWWIAAAGAAVIIAGLAVALRSHWPAGQPLNLARLVRPGAAAGYNVLLITLDTVRSDYLGTYGNKQAETPAIDGLVEHGVQFDRAVTSVPITLPSHTTILTGLYPPHHGVRDNGAYRLDASQTTLAEVLKDHGYDTAAFVGSFVLDARYGLAQGFDVYDFKVTPEGFQPNNLGLNQRSAGAVTDATLDWLGQRESPERAPFFLWVHYFDPHIPYQSPLGNLPRFANRPYDAEIAYVDKQLARLLDELDRRQLRDRTLIAVVSDHGEGLDEHGEATHGMHLYGSTIRVPFILSCSSLFDGPHHVANDLVGLVDLRPTIEALLGLTPADPVDGINLLADSPGPNRGIYLETFMPFHMAHCTPLFGLQAQEQKFIDAPSPEYYDLAADPGELTNLYSSVRAQAQALAAELEKLRQRFAAEEPQAVERDMSPEEIERLRSLGYLGGTATGESPVAPVQATMAGAGRQLKTALQLRQSNRLPEAITAAEDAYQRCKGYVDAVSVLADLYRQAGRSDDAIRVLQESFGINPSSGTALQLARTLMELHRYDEMEAALRRAAAIDPDNGFVHVIRGDRFNTEGRYVEALAQYEQAVAIDDNRVGMLVRPMIEKLKAHLAQGR